MPFRTDRGCLVGMDEFRALMTQATPVYFDGTDDDDDDDEL